VAAGNGGRCRSDGKRPVSESACDDGDAQIAIGRVPGRHYRAMEGSKKAMALRDSMRAQLISALKQVAAYAQENANGDFSQTGFETYDTAARKTGQLVETPTFRKLYHGANSGEIML
jgi:hypothetical protein